MGITDAVKDILSINIKPRRDSYFDQFSRILMVKIMMIGTLVVGLNWYTDRMTCIIPGTIGISGEFVSSACWINGMYIYRDITYHNDIGYYGLPTDINIDGKFENGELCATTDSSHREVKGCVPMEKTFYLQYQYMTFLLAALAFLYYFPYVIFLYVNQDMKALQDALESGAIFDANAFVTNYFINENANPKWKMRARVIGNYIVKIMYIVVAVLGYLITDNALLGGFKSYGNDWLNWTKLENTLQYDYMGKRQFPKPGDALMPSFGLCQVQETAQDIKHVVTNKYTFVCEISQHVLYQYVFIIIWFGMIFAIVVSVLGMVMQLVNHLFRMFLLQFFFRSGHKSRMQRKLTLRQQEYLEFIRKKDVALYGDVFKMLSTIVYQQYGDEKKSPHSESYEIA